MSLAKLLSTGKSLVGGSTENASRYRMGSPGLLPKFGAVSRRLENDAKNATRADAESEVTNATLETKQDAPSIKPVETKEISPQPISPSWFKRVKARLIGIYHRPGRRDIPKQAKAPVQTELSLDKVQVVRNDLSDTDVEIVPAGKDRDVQPSVARSSGRQKQAADNGRESAARELTAEPK